MAMNTRRTSFSLPVTLFHRLQLTARQNNISVSELASRLLDKALARQEQRQIQRTYEVLKEMMGMGGKGDAQVSASIDEVLYGEKGAWRGESTSGAD